MPLGAVMILLHDQSHSAGVLLEHMGLAFIVAGVLSTFHEAVLRKFEQGDNVRAVANAVHEKLRDMPPATGIKLVNSVRKHYSKYYQWITSNDAEDIFLAGRSVLHRINSDLKARKIGKVEDIFARRLLEGARIRILLVDPRSSLIPRLAQGEGQSAQKMLSDIAVSLGVCNRIYESLQNLSLPSSARLDICVFDEIPYFAYHRVGDLVILGFYFSKILGHQSAAYEVIDQTTKDFFAEHFTVILSRAMVSSWVLQLDPSGDPDFNTALFNELKQVIEDEIGKEKAEKLMSS
jgi:hypothetical protein